MQEKQQIDAGAIINYRITNGSIVRLMLWTLLAYSIFFFRELLLTLLVGLVMASTIDPIAKYFQKYKISRTVTVSFVFLFLISFIAIFATLAIPAIAEDLAKVLGRLPIILNDLEKIKIMGVSFDMSDVSRYISEVSKDISKGQILSVLKNSVTGASSVAATTGAVISNIINFILMLIFAFYLAVQDDGIKKFLRLITPIFYEKYVIDLWVRSEKKIGTWAKGQIIVALIVSTLVSIPLFILNIPYAALFAFLAFVGQLIPVVGLLLASIPAVIVSYFSYDISVALIILSSFLLVSQLENYLITPKIMNNLIGVPAIIVLISVIVGAKIAGFWGVVIAVPIAAIFMELVNDIMNDKIPSEHKLETIRYE